ncbi:MAG: hypothetical protein WBA67_08410 [Jannaschia sp.]
MTDISNFLRSQPRPLFAGFGRIASAFQGMIDGYSAYRIYTDLSAMSDGQLKAKGLDRADLARIAMNGARANG